MAPANQPSSASPARFGQLDAMRFGFALIVVVVHTLGFKRTLIHGAFAVDFFFVLSGFVLSHALIGRPMGPLAFAWARLARLYPLHLLALVWLVCLVGIPQDARGTDLPSLLLNLVLLQGLGIVGVDGWNFPSWSISIEFLVNVLVLYPVGRARSILGALAIVAVALVALVHAAGPVFDLAAVKPLYGPLVSGGLLRGIFGIMLGYLLYEAHLALAPRLDPSGYRAAATVFEVLAIAVLGFSLWIDNPAWNVLPVPLSAALVLQMSTAPGHLSRMLQTGPFPALGDISYSIYLLHIPLFAAFSAAGISVYSSSGGPSVLWLFYLAVLMGLATLSFSRLERPAQKWLLQLSKRRTPAGNRAGP